jgi:hypothetical protein
LVDNRESLLLLFFRKEGLAFSPSQNGFRKQKFLIQRSIEDVAKNILAAL